MSKYSGLQSYEVHLRLCSGSINAAATQTKQKCCTSYGCNPPYRVRLHHPAVRRNQKRSEQDRSERCHSFLLRSAANSATGNRPDHRLAGG